MFLFCFFFYSSRVVLEIMANCFRKLLNVLFFDLLKQSDGFTVTVRKFVSTWGVLLGLIALGYFVFFLVKLSINNEWKKEVSSTFIMACSVPTMVLFIAGYLWVRRTKTVTNTAAAIWAYGFNLVMISLAISYPWFPFGIACLTGAVTGIVCEVPKVVLHISLVVLVYMLSVYNAVAVHDDGLTLLALPGVNGDRSRVELFLDGFGGVVIILWTCGNGYGER